MGVELHAKQGAWFSDRLLQWQPEQGRQGLPWQSVQDPYRVWLSEIMLQQTQVATVLGYYERFLNRFPQVTDLAAASESEVMALWAGLGYYSRARNLHACAKQVVKDWHGRFPSTAEELQTLPGVGPSTAAAIAAFCFGQRISICDGNVKRFLSRFLGFDQDLKSSQAQKSLWNLAQSLTPNEHLTDTMPVYTQALMDMGATVCTPRQPRCEACPVRSECRALQMNRVAELPIQTRRLKRKTEHWTFWVLQRTSDDAFWLEPRPERGIWAGLFTFPTVVWRSEEVRPVIPEAWLAHGFSTDSELPSFTHVLTHRDLVIHPVVCRMDAETAKDWASSRTQGFWCPFSQPLPVGIPKAVERVCEALSD